MKQYLLSIYQPDGPPPSSVNLENIMRDVRAVRQQMKTAGAWVFSGGLHPASSATVVRSKDGRRAHDRRPVRRGQGAHRRTDDHQGRRSRRRARLGRKDRRATTLPIEVRPFRRKAILNSDVLDFPTAEIERVFRAGVRPRGCRPGSPLRRYRRRRGGGPGRVRAAIERWPITGLPPSPAGWIITTARHRAIDRFRREASREDRHAQAARLLATDERGERRNRRTRPSCTTNSCG